MANPEDLGRYRLKRLLGRGVLGQVWEANDRHAGEGASARRVAVKIMHAADEELTYARVQFAREGRLASLLRHPYVASVLDSGEAAGTSFMVMEMVDGPSLRKVIEEGKASLDDKSRWLRQVAEALNALHGAGIVHRDLKPENVIIRPDGRACVVDLGIAKWMKFDLGGERDPMDLVDEMDIQGKSMDYAPPETTVDNLYDSLGDQWAWGALGYELLTGSPAGESSPPLSEQMGQTGQTGVDAALVTAVERARSARREDRWDGMGRILEAIAVSTPNKPGGGGAPGPFEAAGPTLPPGDGPAEADASAPGAKKPPPPLLLAGAAVALLVLIGLIVAGLR